VIRLTKRVAVEPLSARRWARIEERLLERLDAERPAQVDGARPRRSQWVAAGLAFVVAAAIGALVATSMFGRPEPAQKAVTPTPADLHIVTGDGAQDVAVGDSNVHVSASSAVLMSGDDAHGVLVVLDHGAVDCEVAPREGRPAFRVQAGDVQVRVIGTRFSVVRDAQSGVHVSVTRGAVDVSAGGHTAIVRAGEEWPASAPSPLPSAQSTRSRVASEPRRPRPASTPPSVVAMPTAVDSSLEPPPTVDSTPAPTISATPAPSAPAVTAAQATPASAMSAPPAQDLYEEATRLEASNPDRALAIYRGLASGSGPWAANALYAAARLQVERGRRGAARQLLGEYLARFPHGPNARDARDLIDQTR